MAVSLVPQSFRLVIGVMTGTTYCGSWMFFERTRSARSLPQSAVGSGTMTFETVTLLPVAEIVESVVTDSRSAVTAPRTAVQSIVADERLATQWRAVATRFGARRLPEQMTSSMLPRSRATPTAKVCVASS